MNISCDIIKDLLPLYHDGVCSEESRAIIEAHLAECASCKQFYQTLKEEDDLLDEPLQADNELKKAASLQAVKKKIRQRHALVAVSVVLVLALLFAGVRGVLQSQVEVVAAEELSVAMVDHSLIARLQGSQASQFHLKRVERSVAGRPMTFLFLQMSATAWDQLTTSQAVFSEYVLCPADKGADAIDGVYYYTGDDTGLESLSAEAWQAVLDDAVLLWHK